LELETALFRPIDAAAKKTRTAHPAQFEGTRVRGDTAGLYSVGQIAQSFRPTKTVEEITP